MQVTQSQNNQQQLNLSSHGGDRQSVCSNRVNLQKQNRILKKTYAKNQIIQECLSTLDIFKSLMQDADQMKNRIIRDVLKTIYLASYNAGDILYDVQGQSNQIFLVFHGQVSLNIRKVVEKQQQTSQSIQTIITNIIQNKALLNQQNNNSNSKLNFSFLQQKSQSQYIYQQVQTFEKGEGFGQAEFIRGRKRDFQACVKTNDSIIGRLNVASFDQVVENYKMRVYYKKLDMFKRCPLLNQISGNRLEFIVNNSKPLILGMSKTLIKQGQYPKCLYLVSKGQIELLKSKSCLDKQQYIISTTQNLDLSSLNGNTTNLNNLSTLSPRNIVSPRTMEIGNTMDSHSLHQISSSIDLTNQHSTIQINHLNESPSNNKYQWKSKKMSKYFANAFQSKQKYQIRKLNEGAFIGDVEIALNQPFGYEVRAVSQKASLYAIDIRLILSQISPQFLQISKIFYEQKLMYQFDQLNQIKQTRRIATQMAQITKAKLTPDQIKIKKQIRKRYLENKVPFSLIDQSSPLQISKMLQRKHSRIKTDIIEHKKQTNDAKKMPVLELFEKSKILKRRRKQSQYHLNGIQSLDVKRKASMVSQLNQSPEKSLTFKIKSQRKITIDLSPPRKNTKQKDFLTPTNLNQISVKSPLSSTKLTLPPIVLLSKSRKYQQKDSPKKDSPSSSNKKIGKQLVNQLPQYELSQEYTLRHRLKQFIHKIQLSKLSKQEQEIQNIKRRNKYMEGVKNR